MSAVLRKMIEAGTGVPPSIMKAEPFWDTFRDVTTAWFVKILGSDVNPVFDYRKGASGIEVKEHVEGQIVFAFDRIASPGLRAISVDQRCSVEIAAARMSDSADNFLESSNVLMRLLLEDPMASLWREFSATMTPGFSDTGQAPFADISGPVDELPPAAHYLETRLTCELAGQSFSITFVLDFDYVRARVSDLERGGMNADVQSVCSAALRRSIRSSSIQLNAVIDHLELTIAECSRLEAGDVLELPAADTEKLTLTAETIDGNVNIGGGSLGAWRDYRALKLQVPVSESFLQEIAEL